MQLAEPMNLHQEPAEAVALLVVLLALRTPPVQVHALTLPYWLSSLVKLPGAAGLTIAAAPQCWPLGPPPAPPSTAAPPSNSTTSLPSCSSSCQRAATASYIRCTTNTDANTDNRRPSHTLTQLVLLAAPFDLLVGPGLCPCCSHTPPPPSPALSSSDLRTRQMTNQQLDTRAPVLLVAGRRSYCS